MEEGHANSGGLGAISRGQRELERELRAAEYGTEGSGTYCARGRCIVRKTALSDPVSTASRRFWSSEAVTASAPDAEGAPWPLARNLCSSSRRVAVMLSALAPGAASASLRMLRRSPSRLSSPSGPSRTSMRSRYEV